MAQPPRYDHRIRRKGGYMWASETNLEGLQFWHQTKLRPSSKPEYAAKDQAEAKKLGYWVAWRTDDPHSRWKGTRGESEVVAAQPSDKPTIHSWDAPVVQPVAPYDQTTGEMREPGADDDSDLPF